MEPEMMELERVEPRAGVLQRINAAVTTALAAISRSRTTEPSTSDSAPRTGAADDRHESVQRQRSDADANRQQFFPPSKESSSQFSPPQRAPPPPPPPPPNAEREVPPAGMATERSLPAAPASAIGPESVQALGQDVHVVLHKRANGYGLQLTLDCKVVGCNKESSESETALRKAGINVCADLDRAPKVIAINGEPVASRDDLVQHLRAVAGGRSADSSCPALFTLRTVPAPVSVAAVVDDAETEPSSEIGTNARCSGGGTVRSSEIVVDLTQSDEPSATAVAAQRAEPAATGSPSQQRCANKLARVEDALLAAQTAEVVWTFEWNVATAEPSYLPPASTANRIDALHGGMPKQQASLSTTQAASSGAAANDQKSSSAVGAAVEVPQDTTALVESLPAWNFTTVLLKLVQAKVDGEPQFTPSSSPFKYSIGLHLSESCFILGAHHSATANVLKKAGLQTAGHNQMAPQIVAVNGVAVVGGLGGLISMTDAAFKQRGQKSFTFTFKHQKLPDDNHLPSRRRKEVPLCRLHPCDGYGIEIDNDCYVRAVHSAPNRHRLIDAGILTLNDPAVIDVRVPTSSKLRVVAINDIEVSNFKQVKIAVDAGTQVYNAAVTTALAAISRSRTTEPSTSDSAPRTGAADDRHESVQRQRSDADANRQQFFPPSKESSSQFSPPQRVPPPPPPPNAEREVPPAGMATERSLPAAPASAIGPESVQALGQDVHVVLHKRANGYGLQLTLDCKVVGCNKESSESETALRKAGINVCTDLDRAPKVIAINGEPVASRDDLVQHLRAVAGGRSADSSSPALFTLRTVPAPVSAAAVVDDAETEPSSELGTNARCSGGGTVRSSEIVVDLTQSDEPSATAVAAQRAEPAATGSPSQRCAAVAATSFDHASSLTLGSEGLAKESVYSIWERTRSEDNSTPTTSLICERNSDPVENAPLWLRQSYSILSDACKNQLTIECEALGFWYPATIRDIVMSRGCRGADKSTDSEYEVQRIDSIRNVLNIHVHVDGWKAEYDEWIQVMPSCSPRLRRLPQLATPPTTNVDKQRNMQKRLHSVAQDTASHSCDFDSKLGSKRRKISTTES